MRAPAGAVLMGSANESTSYERASLALAREIAASGLELPAAYSAIETLHYLPQRNSAMTMWSTSGSSC